MGHPRHRFRRLLHRRLRSSRLVHGLGPQARICTVCHVSDWDWDCGAGLGGERGGTLTLKDQRPNNFVILSEAKDLLFRRVAAIGAWNLAGGVLGQFTAPVAISRRGNYPGTFWPRRATLRIQACLAASPTWNRSANPCRHKSARQSSSSATAWLSLSARRKERRPQSRNAVRDRELRVFWPPFPG